MKRKLRFLTVLAASGFAASACAPAPSPSAQTVPSVTAQPTPTPASPSSSASPVSVLDSANGISFERPAEWTRWQPNAHSPMVGGPLIYLATDPLLPTCATTPEVTPNPADAQGSACEWPLKELGANGVLVTWYTSRILQPFPGDGEAIEVNGATARLRTTKPGGCGAIKADETLELLVPIGQPSPLSNIGLVACLRGPDLTAAEAQVRAMLASATAGR